MSPLYKKEWVVYCKEPFKSAKNVIQYLGRYTHRIAISNRRIISAEEGKVSFHWRDYKDKNRQKVMSLEAVEFIRRFAQHILPPRFMKIRRYGILSNKNKESALSECRKIFKVKPEEKREAETWQQTLLRIKGFDVALCPHCRQGHYQDIETLEPIQLLPRPP